MKEFEPIRLRPLGGAVVAVLLLILSLTALLACRVSPQSVVFPQWVALGAPCLVGLNLIVFMYGLFRRRRYACWAGMALLASSLYVPHMVQIDLTPSDVPGDMRFMTFNARLFRMDYNVPSVQNIEEFVQASSVSTLCLQEVPMGYSLADLKRVFSSLPYGVMTSNANGKSHLAILSRHPIVFSQGISFDERPNCALIADLMIKNHRLRIFNCHLQTTNWNQVKEAESFDPVAAHWTDAFSVVSDNFKVRAKQAEYLGSRIQHSPYAQLVCGDFNDSPLSYTYRTMKGRLKDAFREAGRGYGYTYRYLMKLFRIDFVFFSDTDIKALRYDTGDTIYSDHRPVIVDFKLNF